MNDTRFWVGIDLGSQAHQVCVLNEQREVVLERTVEHSGAALTALADELVALAGGAADAIRVTTEARHSGLCNQPQTTRPLSRSAYRSGSQGRPP